MANKPSRKVENYTGTRITVHSSHPFNVVLDKLYSSIKPSSDALQAWPKIASSISSYDAASKQNFISAVESTVGPHSFMFFQEFDHGVWVPLFNVGNGLKAKRIILGNPLIAITMLKRDLRAGLAVPVELLLLEKSEHDGGGVDLVWQLPSALIARIEDDEELREATEKLDEKLDALVQFVAA